MMFVSLFAGILNLQTGIFRYVNGGHNPPFISRNKGGYKPLLVESNPLVGISEETSFSVTELSLQAGDSLLLYTDGITEATNDQALMFGMNKTQDALNQRQHASMKDLVQSLEAAVETFVGDAAQFDDFTIMGFQYLGEPRLAK